MSTDHLRARPRRPPVVRALTWWATGLLLATAALLLTEPSTTLYEAVAHTGTAWPEPLAGALVIALAASLALATWRTGRRQLRGATTGLAAGVGVGAAYGSSELLKLLVAQERPCRSVLPDPSCPGAENWSFPSNHTTIAFALATAIVLVTRSWWAWSAYLAALAAGAARVVDGVHFPHDVLAGAILGSCTTVAVAALVHPWIHALTERLTRRSDSRTPSAS